MKSGNIVLDPRPGERASERASEGEGGRADVAEGGEGRRGGGKKIPRGWIEHEILERHRPRCTCTLRG